MPCWKHTCRRPAQRFANRPAVEAATFTRPASAELRITRFGWSAGSPLRLGPSSASVVPQSGLGASLPLQFGVDESVGSVPFVGEDAGVDPHQHVDGVSQAAGDLGGDHAGVQHHGRGRMA